MSGATGPDPYLEPASGVLRNLLGITDPGELSQVEAALSTTSGGKLVFHIFGALAEFEREVIRERTKAGLQAANDS